MKPTKRIAVALLIALLLMAQATVAFAEPALQQPATQTITIPTELAETVEAVQDVRAFIDAYYNGTVTDEALMRGAIRGMVESLGDPYAQYIPPEDIEAVHSALEGEYGGVGITIELVDGKVTVMSAFPGSPAQSAGIAPGDVIVQVDQESMVGRSTVDASRLLRGAPGTNVTVGIQRPSTGESIVVQITRQKITIPTMDVKNLGDGVYVISLTQFTDTTERDFVAIMDTIRLLGAKGIILDLRNNPGGLVDASLSIADELTAKGPVLVVTQRDREIVIENPLDKPLLPTVVLVNKGSASASEIVAGAVRDAGDGILVGEKTFGKGCMQAIIDLGEELGEMKMSIADFLTPSKTPIDGIGLTPDIEVKQEQPTLPPEIETERDLWNGMVGLDILALQHNLKFLGFDPGLLDGVFGPGTMTAARSFFASRKTAFRGVITSALLSEIAGGVEEKVEQDPDEIYEAGLQALKTRLATGAWPAES